MASRVRIAVLTEDSSSSTSETWASLIRRLAVATVGDCDTRRIDLVDAPIESHRTMAANSWRNRPSDRRTIALLRDIGRLLREGVFVVFHMDGDRPWERRASSPAIDDFEDQIVTRVSAVLREVIGGPPGPRRRRRDAPPVAAETVAVEVRRVLERLRFACPFYSIEAWLLQSTDRALELCTSRHGGEHADEIRAWARDRALLDELVKPGEHPCLGKSHNAELAAALTNQVFAEVVRAGRSLAATVCHFRESAELVGALEATREWA